jgi:hypothetical protein
MTLDDVIPAPHWAPARRAFGRYWLVVRRGSGLVRVSWLHAAERRALA